MVIPEHDGTLLIALRAESEGVCQGLATVGLDHGFEQAIRLSLLRSQRAPVKSRCLNREIHSGPRRKLARLPARYLVGERNLVVGIRPQVGVNLPVAEHL